MKGITDGTSRFRKQHAPGRCCPVGFDEYAALHLLLVAKAIEMATLINFALLWAYDLWLLQSRARKPRHTWRGGIARPA